MSIQKQFIVRYRIDGHVRFQVPEQLSDASLAEIITNRIAEIDGVYRVKIFRRQRKLSIRYQETVCDFADLAKQLFEIIDELDQKKWFEKKLEPDFRQTSKDKLKHRVKNLKVARWLGTKYQDTKETLHAAKVLTKLGLKKPGALVKDPEKVIIDFLNDILVLYLIKIHWTRITKDWIPRPIVHRYEWTAVFYMFYLLIRSRRPKK